MDASAVRSQCFYTDDLGGVLYVLAMTGRSVTCVCHRPSRRLPLEPGARRALLTESLAQWALRECRPDEIPVREARVSGDPKRTIHLVRGYDLAALCSASPAVPTSMTAAHDADRCPSCIELAARVGQAPTRGAVA